MGDTLVDESGITVNSPINADGKTAQGNDPLTEFHFPTELDPQRTLPDTGSTYLDRQQRVQSEVRRAKVEGREPDLENPGPDASNPLRSAAYLNNPMNVNQQAVIAKSEPAVVVDPEDLGLVETDNGLVAKGTEVVSGSTTENELGVRVPLEEDLSDPNGDSSELEDPDVSNEEESDESDNGSSDSSDSSDSNGSGVTQVNTENDTPSFSVNK